MTALLALVAVVAALSAPMVWDLVRGRGLRRLAVRNVVRRPGEAALVVAGAALGTAIITSAFVVGDTLDASIRDHGRTSLGPIDEEVVVQDPADLDRVVAAVDPASLPGSDGVMTSVGATAAVVAPDGPAGVPRAEPAARVAEIDFAAARAFGDDAPATGLADAGATPRPGEVVVNERLANDLEVGTGDAVEVHAYGRTAALEVRAVVPRLGVAGFADAFVAPGTLAGLADSSGGATAGAPPLGSVLVSNAGGVFDGADRTDAVTDALDERLAGVADVEVVPLKQDVLEAADEAGTSLRTLFSSLGSFSAIVGVLLLVNLFVMLAEERKPELGMMRAVGLKRSHLVRLFGLEGGLYSLIAALAGAVLGLGVAQAVLVVTRSILDGEDDMALVFAAEPASLVAGGLIGLTISLLTVWGTSLRIARLNVIRALRDLPEPAVRGPSLRRAVAASAGALAGAFLLRAGLAGGDGALVTLAPAVVLFCAVPLAARQMPRRAAVTAAAGLSGAWAVFAPEIAPDAFVDAGFEMMLVQGLVLVAAGVALASQADRVWARAADLVAERGGLAARLALAYPLARRGRTGILLAMFSLVVFTLTLMSVINASESARAPELTREASAGWDMWVDSSPSGPVERIGLATVEGVAEVAPLLTGVADITTPAEPEAAAAPVTGIDGAVLDRGVPLLADRDGRYPDDRAAFAAVAEGEDLAIAAEDLLQGEGPPGEAVVAVGDTVTVTDPVTGDRRPLTVVGLAEADWAGNGVLTARRTVEEVLGPRATESRHYVAVAAGVDATDVAHRITAEHLEHGADAHTFRAVVDAEMRESNGFMRLMQGYLALGLVIGIAGLGVVMVRAVRERRRHVGMLRAIGFPARVVRRAFLLEAAFVAVQGVVIGVVLGLVTARQMLGSDTFDDPVPFRAPWVELGLLVVVPAAAAMAAAVVPAARAARISPAAALRTPG